MLEKIKIYGCILKMCIIISLNIKYKICAY